MHEPLAPGQKRSNELVTKTQENLKRNLSAEEHKLVKASVDEFNTHAASGGFKTEGGVSLGDADSGKVFITPDAKEFPDLKALSEENVQKYLVSKEFKALPDELRGKVKNLSRGSFGEDLLKLEELRGGFETRAVEADGPRIDPLIGEGRGSTTTGDYGDQRAIERDSFEERRSEVKREELSKKQEFSNLQDRFTEFELKRITNAATERARRLYIRLAENRVREGQLRGVESNSGDLQKKIERSQRAEADKGKKGRIFSRRAGGFIPNFAPRVEAAQGIPKTQEYQPVDKLLDDYLAAQPGAQGETSQDRLKEHFNNDPKLVNEHYLKLNALDSQYGEAGDRAIERQIADNGGKFHEKYTVDEYLEAKKLNDKFDADFDKASYRSKIMEAAFRGEFNPEKSAHLEGRFPELMPVLNCIYESSSGFVSVAL